MIRAFAELNSWLMKTGGIAGEDLPQITFEWSSVASAHQAWRSLQADCGSFTLSLNQDDPPYTGTLMGFSLQFTVAKCKCCGRTK